MPSEPIINPLSSDHSEADGQPSASDRARLSGLTSSQNSVGRLIEHEVMTLVGQRVFGIALGYEDLVDHDQLRHDPAMAVLAGKLSARRKGLCATGRQKHAQPAGAGRAGADALSPKSPGMRRRSRPCLSSCSWRRTNTRPTLMSWCEANGIDFLFGLARNERLVAELAAELAWAEEESKTTGQPARRFKEFSWSTRDSWSRQRRGVAKAEWTAGEANPPLCRHLA